MSTDPAEIRKLIREQLRMHLPKDAGADSMGDDAPLITGGLLDSVAALKIIDQLEETYGIEFDPEELSADFLDTVTQITELVSKKIAAAG
jgi:acyl carrier protein